MDTPGAIEDLRIEYETVGIDFDALHPDPIEQFEDWFGAAWEAGVHQANAMTLATAVDGRVRARVVLLKGFDHDGFVFYTNLQSAKGREIEANPAVAMTFLWLDLHRQVRIEGEAGLVDAGESDDYFASRPRGAQLAASVSPQSAVIGDRVELEAAIEELDAATAGGDVPRPAHWGGIRVRPTLVEFWQGRLHRLHDRARYRRDGDRWVIERLAP